MYIDSLNIKNFRNYKKLNVTFNRNLNIIYGKNAQGKTNLLESIYVLAVTKSHRSLIDNSLLKNGEDLSIIKGSVKLEKSSLTNKFEIQITKKNKLLKIDENIIKKVSDYVSNLKVIIFYPDDLEIIKGSPNLRRRYINIELSQIYKKYFIYLSDYNKVLKMRNDYLKIMSSGGNYDLSYFNILTNYLVDKAIFIYDCRCDYIDRLNKKVSKIFYNISNIKEFYVTYKCGFDVIKNKEEKENFKKKLLMEFEKVYYNEIKYKTTLIGPHRDDIEFWINDLNLRSYGSQGQQRMAILSLKLAEIEILKECTGDVPILLLDDVFSELDIEKRNNLLSYIEGDIQTIITTTDLTCIDEKIVSNSKLIEIDQGKIIYQNEVI